LVSADPVRNFTLTVDERIRALTIGVPAYAARKRKIEDHETRLVAELVERHQKLMGNGMSHEATHRALEAAARAFPLEALNRLVADHNRWYPIEANLPLDRLSRKYLVCPGSRRPWRPESPYTAERLVRLALARAVIDPAETAPSDEG
jgi:hypothetical protein